MDLSQNKKIGIAALSIFSVSFMALLFFVDDGGISLDKLKTDVFQHDSHSEEHGGDQETFTGHTEEVDYESLVEKDNDTFFVTNTEGRLKYFSRHSCVVFGEACEELVGKSLFEQINAEDLPELVESYSKVIKKGEEISGIGPYRVELDEAELLLMFSIVPVFDTEDEVDELIFTLRDITKKVEELNQKIENSEEQSYLKNLSPAMEKFHSESASIKVSALD